MGSVTTGKAVAIARKVHNSSPSESGGSSRLPYDADVEVEAGGDLSAALGANGVIYVSGDITIDSSITVPTGKHIHFKDGVTVSLDSALSSNHALDASSSSVETQLTAHGTVTIDFGHSGKFYDGSFGAEVTGMGTFKFTGATVSGNQPFGDANGYVEKVIWENSNGANRMNSWSNGGLTVNHMTLIGAGASSSMTIFNYHINKLIVKGDWDTYADPVTSNFSIFLSGTGVDHLSFEGDASNTHSVYLSNQSHIGYAENSLGSSDNIALAVNDGSSVLATNGGFRATPTGTASSHYGAMEINTWDAESGTSNVNFFGAYAETAISIDNITDSKFLGGTSSAAITFSSTADRLRFIGHSFEAACVFSSGSTDHSFTECDFQGNETIPSGAGNLYSNCTFGGTVTVDSGAGARFVDCVFESTFTNNDSHNTRVIGCRNSSDERWMNNDGRIEFKPTSTTDATKTQLFIDASSLQFDLASNDVLHGTLKVTCVRDNQNEAVFRVPVFTAKNDGGTTTVSAPGMLASLPPTDSSGTGLTLTLDVEADDTNDAPAFYITCNAIENWDTVAELTFTVVNK